MNCIAKHITSVRSYSLNEKYQIAILLSHLSYQRFKARAPNYACKLFYPKQHEVIKISNLWESELALRYA